MIGQTVSHYKILEKLGEGGMGAVYLAEDTNLGRKVAVKFLSSERAADPESRKRFIHEARAQALVSHANVASFYEVGEEKDKVFIVMEYIEGQKLSELAKTEKLPLPEVLDLTIQVGEGLQAAHERGVMHRDINPTNILVTAKRVAKITDFGLAKWKGASTITRTGLQMGTDHYMSPEQVDERKADHRTDIFSFGVVLYELICARRPFEGTNRESLFYEILYTQPRPLARYSHEASENLERIVSKCLAKKPDERYQSAADLVADLKKERKSIESGEHIPFRRKKKWKRLLPFLVPAGIGLAVLLFLIFKPFSIEIGAEKETAAAQNSLAVMYFENVVDPEDKDKTAQMITSLLITGLSESENLRVISRQRLYDILNLMGKGDVKVIDRKLASEVAKKAGVRWILTGEVLQTKPNFLMTAEVSEAKGGKILASQKVSGTSGEDLFAVVDKLSAEIKKDLSLPAAAKDKPDKLVADVTTHSTQAYRCYLEGLDYWNKAYLSEAEESFKKALTLDSTFAMVYLRLALISFLQDSPGWGKEFIAKAAQYSDKVSRREKEYIKGFAGWLKGSGAGGIEDLKKLVERYPDDKELLYVLALAYLFKPQYEEAIVNLNKAIELDPRYGRPYNLLAYAYGELGDFERANRAVNKYIELAPGEANPYDTRGDLYANQGKIEPAIESYKKALEIKPDFYWSLEKLGHMYLFKRDYVRAESCYQRIFASGDKGQRSWARHHLALLPIFQGKFNEALVVFDQTLAADRLERAEGRWLAQKHLAKATIYREQKNWQMALQEGEKVVEFLHKTYPADPVYGRNFYLWLLTMSGQTDRALEVAQVLKRDLEKADTTFRPHWWHADGTMKLVRGKLTEALISFEKAAAATSFFPYHVILAETYFKLGRLGESVSRLEKRLSRYDDTRLWDPIWNAKAYYLLGLAYEKSGWNQKAIKNYEEFLEIWKNADPGIAEVEDARQRLAKLKKKV